MDPNAPRNQDSRLFVSLPGIRAWRQALMDLHVQFLAPPVTDKPWLIFLHPRARGLLFLQTAMLMEHIANNTHTD